MTATETKKLKTKNLDRISLTNENTTRVGYWLSQVNARLTGLKINRTDLVNWLISQKETELREDELLAVQREFFDPLKSLEWAIKKAKEAKARGEDLDVQELLQTSLIDPKLKNQVRRLTKKTRKKDTENGTSNVPDQVGNFNSGGN